MGVTKQHKKQILKSITQKLFALIALIVLAFSVVQISKTFASGEVFTVTNLEVIAKSDTVDVNELKYKDNTIISDITMHKVGDSITYRITIANKDSKEYTITSVSDNNQDEYISYVYENYEGTKIGANSSKDFNITQLYAKEQTDVTKRDVESNVRFTFNFVDDNGDEKQEDIEVKPSEPTNPTKPSKIDEIIDKVKSPQTGDKIELFFATGMIALIILIATLKKRTVKVSETKVHKAVTKNAVTKKEKPRRVFYSGKGKHAGKGYKFLALILAVALVFPSISKAASDSISFYFKTNIHLNSSLIVKVDTDGDGKTEEIVTKYNEPIGEITVPEKEGYEPSGWVDDEGNEIDPEKTPITKDTTITPKYTPKKYTIIYEGLTDDEKASLNNTTTYTIESEDITLTNPADRLNNEGKKIEAFIGWREEGKDETTKTITIKQGSTGNRKFTATWQTVTPEPEPEPEPETYTITYNLNGGTVETENPETYTEDTPTFTLNNPSKTGYVFTGWTGSNGDEPEETVEIVKGTKGNLNYTANFTVETFTITLDLQGGEGETTITREYGEPIGDLPEPTKEGYDFDGWFTETTGGDEVIPTTPVTGEMEIHAQWSIINYTITYNGLTDAEKTSLNNPTSYTIESNSITLVKPANRYDNDGDLSEIFIGWNNGTSTSLNVTIAAGSTGNKEYTAMWQAATPDTYVITYDLNGDSVTVTNPNSYTKFDAGITLNNPTREGYNFTGWSGTDLTGENNTNVVIPTGSRGNRTYTAHWSPIEYTITYNGLTEEEKQAASNPTSYTIEDNNITLTNPTREGYTFAGWSGTDLAGENNNVVTIAKGSIGNKEYTAHFQINSYTITLDVNGGDALTQSTYEKEYNQVLGTLPIPTREGYTFTGWEDANHVINITEETQVQGDMTLQATWRINTYTVRLNANYGDTPTTEDINLDYNEYISIYEHMPSRDGYNFVKFTSNPNGSGQEYVRDSSYNNFSTEDGALVEIYAQWEGIEYTISYQYNYDMTHHAFMGPSGETTYTPEDCPINIENPTAVGFTFDGWSTSPSGVPSTNFIFPEGTWNNQTIYGFFTPINYSITYNYDGGELPYGESNASTYTVEDIITLTEPVKEGHTFIGWSVVDHDFSGWVSNINGNLYAEDITVVAHYSTNSYTISFESNGGTQYASRSVEYGQPLGTLETPIRPGYTFNGWYSNSNPSVEVTENTLCTGDDTLYAYWSIDMYTITYNGLTNEELSNVNNPTAYTVEDSTITLNNPQDRLDEDGDVYESFAGWQEGDDQSNVSTNRTIEQGSTGSKTFTAIWNEVDPPTYTITYNTHGFATTTQNPEFYTKKTETFTLSNAEAPGYIFKGWSGTDLYGDENQTVTIPKGSKGDRSYELHMTPITYDITFDANGGQGDQITETYTYDVNGHLPANPYTKEGYTFVEWNESADGLGNGQQPGDNVLNKTTVDREVITYYAIWQPNTYTISYNANSDGVTGDMQDQQAVYDQAIRLIANTFAKLGFKFDGWDTLANGTGTRYADEEEVTNLATDGTVDLYAQWAVTPYTIIFDKNNENATGTMANMRVPYGEAVNLNPITYTYTDHKLVEWNTKADGTGTGYADEAEVMNLDIDGEVTLYAQWRDVEAIFAAGGDVKAKFKSLANDDLTSITSIKYYEGTPDISSFTEDNIVSRNTSPDPIYAWLDNGTMYYWSEDATMELNVDARGMFNGLSKVTEIDLSAIRSNNTTDMAYIFDGCSQLQSIDLSTLNTENVTYMMFMFRGCTALTELNLDNLNTEKVTSMNSMFRDCSGLTSIDITGFDTTIVNSMAYMFYGCRNITEINVSELETGNVTDMSYMFSKSGITTLDMDGWDTSKVRTTSHMFASCPNLTNIDVSPLGTNDLRDMNYMFEVCSNLESVNFGDEFDTSKVTNMGGVFFNTTKLKVLDLTSFNTANVTNMGDMFRNAGAVTVYVSENYDVTNVNSSSIFGDAVSIVGGMGTAYNGAHVNKEYARIDDPVNGNPGYFTDKATLNIMYYPNGNSVTGTMTNQTTGANTDIQLNANQYVNLGYAFGGWNTKADGSGTHYDDEQVVSGYGRLDLYAQWGLTPYTVIFDKNAEDATGTMANISKAYGEHFNLPANEYTRDDFVFKGWNTKADGTGTHYDDEQEVINLDVDGEITLYAEWESRKYTITFDKNSETAIGEMINEIIYYGAEHDLTKNTFTNTGYKFGGWNTKADLTGTHYDDEQSVLDLGDITLYAEWGKTPYTIIFDKNDPSATGTMENMTVAYGERVNLNNNSYYRELAVFKGWNTKANGRGTHYDDGAEVINLDIDGEVTLYAEWDIRIAYLKSGPEVNRAMKRLANDNSVNYTYFDSNVLEIRKYIGTLNLDDVDYATISTNNSYYPVYAWFDSDSKIVYWYTEVDKIYLNSDSSYLFNNFLEAKKIDFTGFDTSLVKNMDIIFGGNEKLEELDLSGLNVSNVTTMYKALKRNKTLTTINLTGWDTRNVTNMSNLFEDDISLINIQWDNNWKTDNVTNMSYMFNGCSSLKELDLHNWKTDNVTNMSYMFTNCSSMETIDFGGYQNGVNINNTAFMFDGCNKLQNLNLILETSSALTIVEGMYRGCSKLTSIDLSKMVTSNVTGINGMFAACESIIELDLSTFDTNKVGSYEALFRNMTNLRTIYVSDKFTIRSNANISRMFIDDINLVGGAGTTFSSSHITGEYAHIDGGVDNPGYFTDIADKPDAGTNGTNSVNPLSASPASVNAPLNTNMVTPNGINGRTLNTNIDENTEIDDDADIDADTNGDLNTNTEVDSTEELDNVLDKETTGTEITDDSDVVENTNINSDEDAAAENSETNDKDSNDSLDDNVQDTEDTDTINEDTKVESVSNNETEDISNEEVTEQGTDETKED